MVKHYYKDDENYYGAIETIGNYFIIVKLNDNGIYRQIFDQEELLNKLKYVENISFEEFSARAHQIFDELII